MLSRFNIQELYIDLKEVYNIEIINTPWLKTGKFLLFLFGIPITVISTIVSFINIDVSLPFLINGLLWLVIGTVSIIIGVYRQRTLNTFKSTGVCYDASVVKILPAYGIRIFNYVTAKTHCVYQDNNGNNCLVKSGYYLLNMCDDNENLIAKVYVIPQKTGVYKVELFRKIDEKIKIKVDIDYT